MSAITYTMHDSATMLRRNLRRSIRYPVTLAVAIGTPIVLLLLFVYVFGDTLGAGIAGGGRADYLAYVTPAIIVIAVAGAVQGTAISVAMDMTEGIITRFRTMAIARVSVLTGHVWGTVIQTMLAIVVVIAAALLLGFRPSPTPIEWLALIGLLTLLTFALTWLSVALGLVTKSVESASNLPMPLMLLPFLGSGFVPTDSLPTGLSWFAEYQPFTPVMETLRGLLMGTAIGNSGVQAVAWCVGIGLVGYLWARQLYNRDPRP
jgi:ABC-2 type transport system permease protein